MNLELLAPARNADIGIAAIDCGADAVYIAGPDFGARKQAGNPMEEISRLCRYAHRFGARVFVTFNILLREGEEKEFHSQMLSAQDAGADAFIVRDLRVLGWEDIRVPIHASTQCAIRTPEKALEYAKAGCSRVIVERELPLETIGRIAREAGCEVEAFVHGALCVCYSGECGLSEHLTQRSGDRGDCIQACRSLYTLKDAEGKILVKDKALLSLKDLSLIERLEDLASCGVSSFKIEGRLKSISYVRNVVRAYSLALDAIVRTDPEKFSRSSFGRVSSGFSPDLSKTFNRGYTTLFLDGKRGEWASMDSPKSMGERIGKVLDISPDALAIELDSSVRLSNGDGFAFVGPSGITGFRGDVCRGRTVFLRRRVEGLFKGAEIWRNISAEFEKKIEAQPCLREIPVRVKWSASDGLLSVKAISEDGRIVTAGLQYDQTALSAERSIAMINEGLGKRASIYSFTSSVDSSCKMEVPFLRAAQINALRRELADKLDSIPCNLKPLSKGARRGGSLPADSSLSRGKVLMRSKYCIRYALGLCPKYFPGSLQPKYPLFLENNSRTLQLAFDCTSCEMLVLP